MKRTYLIDSENINDVWVELLHCLDEKDEILVFYTDKSSHMSYDRIIRLLEQKRGTVRWLKCFEGQNALDFQLVTELGSQINQEPKREYIIVSNDTGYDAVVRYWQQREYRVRRMKGAACEVMASAEKNAAEKAAAETAAAEKLAAEQAAAEKIAAERAVAEKVAAEKAALEQAAAEKAAAERAAAEKIAAEKAAAERIAAERAEKARLAAEQLAAEKIAAEKLAAGRLDEVEMPEEVQASVVEQAGLATVQAGSASVQAASTAVQTTPASAQSEWITEQSASASQQSTLPGQLTEEEPVSKPVSWQEELVRIFRESGSQAPQEDLAFLQELCKTVKLSNMSLMHNVLEYHFGQTAGNAVYRYIKENPGCRGELSAGYSNNKKQREKKYLGLILKRNHIIPEEGDEDAILKILGGIPRKNLNSIHTAMVKKFGQEEGGNCYAVLRNHVSIIRGL